MKPYCITLINRCRNSAIFSFPSQKTHNSFTHVTSKLNLGLDHHRKIHSYTPRLLGFPCIFYRTQLPFCGQTSSWGLSGVFSRTCNGDGACGGVNVVSSVASNIRSYSSSVETRVNEKNFERICVHGGMNVKPLVVERMDRDESIGIDVDSMVEGGVENVSSENLKGLNEVAEVVKASKEESDIEREAWRILQEAVVTYCGNPVGTVAANDPADKLPLNYDQVFIRDFVPSALAFLLKGEAEIVRNFLLHTLQLQFTLACMKMGRPELARKALDMAENRLSKDHWPEYYDTRNGKFMGKQARLYQTWSVAGFLTSKMLLENPEMASRLFWDEDYELLEVCACGLRKSGRSKCSRVAAKSHIRF